MELEGVSHRLLSLMVMLFTPVDPEFGENLAAQLVVRDHSADSKQDKLFRAAGAHAAGSVTVVTANLFPGEHHFLRIDHDDVIAVVDVRGISDFVFSTEDIGGFHGDIAEDSVVGID